MCEPRKVTEPGDAIALLEALRLRAAELPDMPAILAPGRPPLTFAALWDHVEYLAQALACRGLGRNDVVAAVLPDDAETLCAFLGVCAVAGFAPLDSNLADVELDSCLEDLRPAALLAPAGVRSRAAGVAEALGIPVLEARPSSERGAGLFTLAGLDAAGAAAWAMPEPSSLALLLRTSATTGRAKFVCLTHANLAAMAQASAGALMLSQGDRFLNMMPMFHLQGMLSAFEQLMVGGSVVCAPAFDADRFAFWVDEFQPTWYTAGPVLHRAILALRREAPERTSWPRLRFVRSVGSALPAALLHELEETLQVPIVEGYGLTEVGAVTSTPLFPHCSKLGSAGIRIVAGVEIADESGNLLPARRTGEIVVRGPNVMREYRDDPEATAAAFRDGWFRSGDLGFFDDDGYLYVTGRIKEMINRGGEKILPGEIDKVLMAHPAVADVAAFGLPHPTLGEEVGVAVVPRAGASVTASELRQFAALSLAAFKTPRRVFFVEAIPKGPTGKPQRHKVAELALTESDNASEPPYIPAATALEKALAQIWVRVLDIGRAGMEDDFFALGGDSFAMTLMLAEVATEFEAPGDPLEFLMNPTLATLAGLVAARNPDGAMTEASPVCALQPRGGRVPFFCIPGASGDPYYFRYLARRLGSEQPLYVLRSPRTAGEGRLDSVEQTAGHFVQAIKGFQPQGPYALGGHCYGGIVAFEVARQMSAAGEHIALLTLFDTPTPRYPRVMRRWRRYREEALALTRERHISARELMVHAVLLARLAGRYLRSHLERAAAKVRLQFQPVEGEAGKEASARLYVPRPFPGKAVAFLAADERHSKRVLDDARLGWRDFVLGGLDVRSVAGMHDSMFTEPHVQHVAHQLAALLDPLNSRAESTANDSVFSAARSPEPSLLPPQQRGRIDANCPHDRW
jgi:acyl-CoA synthetase (AMP-forming)/AMP-acid ligase II/thioesterase domain-containing protein